MDNKYPYKRAKLVHHKRDLSKRWHSSCWLWNIELNKLVRKRYFAGINRYKTIGERMEAGKQLVDYINEKLKISKLNKGMIHDFLDNLFASGTIASNKTYNNYLGTINAVLNYLISRDHKIFSRNPAADIKKLHTSTKKHAAYSNEQMAELKHEIIKKGDPQLLLFKDSYNELEIFMNYKG